MMKLVALAGIEPTLSRVRSAALYPVSYRALNICMTNEELIAIQRAEVAETRLNDLRSAINDTISLMSGWKFISPTSKQVDDAMNDLKNVVSKTDNVYTTTFGPYMTLGEVLGKGYKVTKLLNGIVLGSEKFDDRETALIVKQEWEAQNK